MMEQSTETVHSLGRITQIKRNLFISQIWVQKHSGIQSPASSVVSAVVLQYSLRQKQNPSTAKLKGRMIFQAHVFQKSE